MLVTCGPAGRSMLRPSLCLHGASATTARKRRSPYVGDLAKRLVSRAQITTDGHLEAIEGASVATLTTPCSSRFTACPQRARSATAWLNASVRSGRGSKATRTQASRHVVCGAPKSHYADADAALRARMCTSRTAGGTRDTNRGRFFRMFSCLPMASRLPIGGAETPYVAVFEQLSVKQSHYTAGDTGTKTQWPRQGINSRLMMAFSLLWCRMPWVRSGGRLRGGGCHPFRRIWWGGGCLSWSMRQPR
jgi:hypothetical protein